MWTSVATINAWDGNFIGDQLQGVTVTASSTFAGFPASQCNDGNNATAWITNSGGGGSFVDPTDLIFDFGATSTNWRDLRQFQFTSRTDGFYTQYPKSIEWAWSDDNITYTTTVGPVTTPQPTAAGQFYVSPSVGPATAERVSESAALVAARVSANAINLVTGQTLVALNYPAAFEKVSQVAGLVTVKNALALRTSEAAVLVAVKGRTANPKLRAWTFTLDGHDFYVLRLGTMGTLVYDLYSGQWMDWDAFSQIYWPVNCGFNWVDGQGVTDSNGNTFGSNVVVGDDTYPLLWILEPLQPYDQSPDGPLDPQQQYNFTRILQGQFPVVGREVVPCYAAWLTTDMGNPGYVGAGVKLEISDDAGASYQDMGTITVTAGNNFPELAWYSLGQIAAPGRLFRITDDGAVARIDTLEMNDPDDGKK